ncbi:hypothetical protein FACS1894203_0810 [Bacteroidia bacterium]|nr:hypothetical protein FACS1894203_0810 [Bacteroidia bacterium]GHU89546.1 hypothetical protein FACS1894155_06740 [Bacteroidia bacterium]
MSKANNIVSGSLIFFIIHFSLFIIHSCTAPFDISTDDSEPVIVIYGTITDELKQQEIRISRSSPYFQDEPNIPVSGATVTIESSDKQIYELFEVDTIPGLYCSKSVWAVIPGKTYNLAVQADFNKDGIKENYGASTTIPSKFSLDSLSLNLMNIMGHKNYSLNIYGQEPPGDDYYLFKYIVNDTLVSTKISDYKTYDDIGINDQYLNGLTIDYFDHIDNWVTDTEDQRKRSIYLKPGDVIIVKTSNIPKEYHNFINQCRKEMYGENPIFGGPASNIVTNITGGGVGFFGGYCITKNSITAE